MLTVQRISNIYHTFSNRISTIGFGEMGWNINTVIVFPSGIMCVRFKGEREPVIKNLW